MVQDTDSLVLAARHWACLAPLRPPAVRFTQSTLDLISYDVAVLANGSKAFVPPLPGLRESNPHVYRTVKDAEKLQQVAKPDTRATVIGGGLFGLEVAYGMLQQGVRVTVLQGAERVMNQQLEANVGALLTNKLKAMGLAVMVSTKAASVRHENGLNQAVGGGC